jgi:hypothetical protein
MTVPENPGGATGDGVVVMDIGGDVGGLVLYTAAELVGREIDLTSLDDAHAHTHSAVRERHHGGLVRYAAVYPSLRAARYAVAGSSREVTIVGGRVTEVVYDGGPLAVPPD